MARTVASLAALVLAFASAWSPADAQTTSGNAPFYGLPEEPRVYHPGPEMLAAAARGEDISCSSEISPCAMARCEALYGITVTTQINTARIRRQWEARQALNAARDALVADGYDAALVRAAWSSLMLDTACLR